ncbi:MAG: hypothetical protein JW888_02010 [Pirellulales bacterium]|nr:hypothetical protein [Pirellulales bacterium]
MEHLSLQSRIRAVRRRLLIIGTAAAGCWGLTLALVVVLAGVWLDLLWELPASCRIAGMVVAAVVGIGLSIALTLAASLAARAMAVARGLDRAAHYGGDILTGWELDRTTHLDENSVIRQSRHPEVTTQLSKMAVSHAARLAEKVPVAKAAPARPLTRSLFGLAVLLLLIGGLIVGLPELARTEWNRFRNPLDDVPPFSLVRFDVVPGDAEVVYGGELDIRASVTGAAVDDVELVLANTDDTEEVLPMFREQDGRWRTVLSQITSPADYFLRAHGARTRRYSIRVITVPRIEDVRIRIIPPAYTRRAEYEGPLPREGIAGLAGTKIEIRARSNRPLSEGTLMVVGGRAAQPDDPAATASPNGPIELDLLPIASETNSAAGSFIITGDGKFELHVRDVAGQSSQESFAGTITCLPDERPFVHLLQPRSMSFATPTIELPVEVSAEDDYGISRIQLYRSLNDSRPLPTDLPLGRRPTNSADELVTLPLRVFGLRPGDVIKLFGRVEDNDPAGAKGAESSVVTVRIISQGEFERMVQAREGIDVLLSKYREAQRRMESLGEEIDKLQKELESTPPGDKQADKLREKMEKLRDRLQKESQALRELSETRLPVDLDENLSPQIAKLADMTGQMAGELEKLLKESSLNREPIERQLKKMAKQLQKRKQQYNEQASKPMEHLAVVFPLMVDQQRFTMLVLRQDDLLERLASLKDRDGEDDPALKIRMRDLEEEQRQIREDLQSLLVDIEEHITKLPDEEPFDELRQSATDFVDDLRDSRAEEAMVEAEAGLGDFSGTVGYERAKEASEILHRFLKECNGGMGQCANNCLRFQPTLCNSMGNSANQLMAMMGLGNAPGNAMGSGGMGPGSGGFSAQRGGYGVYGGLPGMMGSFGDTGQGRSEGKQQNTRSSRFFGGRHHPEEKTVIDDLESDDASGIGEGAIPVHSRRRVGQYFLRVNEETNNSSE